jgi:hypothetical protein
MNDTEKIKQQVPTIISLKGARGWNKLNKRKI